MKAISLPLGPDEHTAFKDAAGKAGLPLVRWIRTACHAHLAQKVEESRAGGVTMREYPPLGPTEAAPEPPSKPVRKKRSKALVVTGTAAEIPYIPEFEELAAEAGVPLEPIVKLAEKIEQALDKQEARMEAEYGPIPEETPPEPPSLPPVSQPEPVPKPRHNFNRHPKCTTEKCERFGNACPLCNLVNAISF